MIIKHKCIDCVFYEADVMNNSRYKCHATGAKAVKGFNNGYYLSDECHVCRAFADKNTIIL